MKERKSIWIFNHYAITPDLLGGTRHFDFGKELVKRGYKIIIFASSFYFLYPRVKYGREGKRTSYLLTTCWLPYYGMEK